MLDFLMEHASGIVATLALMTAAALITSRWESFSLWLLATWHSVPVVGTIAALARRAVPRGAGRVTSSPSSSPVMALASDYARYIRVLNRADYDNYMSYLRKSGDLGRRPFPPFLWFVIFSMVIVEAAGFAYVLAGWTLPGASEVMQQIAALGIGFLVAVILVFFTHWAGVEIYQSNQHRRDRRQWIEAGRATPLYGPDLSLNEPQSVDDGEPAYRQRATRGHGKTTYLLTIVTLFMVVSIGGGAAYVRGQVLEQELVVESATRVRAMERFDLNLPAAVARERVAAEREAIAAEITIKRRGGWGTLVVLVIIFFFLQVLGMFFGYRYSFNGRLSRDAYRAVNADHFSSYSELVQYYDRIADIAQSRVEQLQQAIERRRGGALGRGWGDTPLTFRDYLQLRDAQRRDKPLGGEAAAPFAVTPLAVEVPAAPAVSGIAETKPASETPFALAAPVTATRIETIDRTPEAAPAKPEFAEPEPAKPEPANPEPVAAKAEPSIAPLPDAAASFVESLVAPPAETNSSRRRPTTLGGAAPEINPRTVLDQAEIEERQRAAERHARMRGKTPPRKTSRVNEPESR
jgi:hypothetical protein